jgi:predicted RNA-binding protein YlqC (UPF0109 family)
VAQPRCPAERHGQESSEGEEDRLKELLEFLAKTLVDRPDQVQVREYEEDSDTIVFELLVAEEDRGKVIGRQGRTVKALRTIMKAGGVKDGKRILVDVAD